jgi:hypothetical protein
MTNHGKRNVNRVVDGICRGKIAYSGLR